MQDREESRPQEENQLIGRNAVLEAFRAGRTIERLYVQSGVKDGPVLSILREAGKTHSIVSYVSKERLRQLCGSDKHQGVVAVVSPFLYSSVEQMLQNAAQKGRPPFLILLDGIEDPHNLGAIIRTANLSGADGVIIPKRRCVGLTAAVGRASAGAISHMPVAKVSNLTQTIQSLKDQGIWFVCADMAGQCMYELDLTGPIGLLIGSEGSGVSELLKQTCDMRAAIPMQGDIDSLNASVAAGVLSYEIVRQRMKAAGEIKG